MGNDNDALGEEIVTWEDAFGRQDRPRQWEARATEALEPEDEQPETDLRLVRAATASNYVRAYLHRFGT